MKREVVYRIEVKCPCTADAVFVGTVECSNERTIVDENTVRAAKVDAEVMLAESGWGTIVATDGDRLDLCPDCSSTHEEWLKSIIAAGKLRDGREKT